MLQVAGCGCDYASVERLNRDTLHPLLNSLVQLPYFRYFKVRPIIFWPFEVRYLRCNVPACALPCRMLQCSSRSW